MVFKSGESQKNNIKCSWLFRPELYYLTQMAVSPSPFLVDLFQDANNTPLDAHSGGTVQWQKIVGAGGSNTIVIANNGTVFGAVGASSSIGVYASSVLPQHADCSATASILYQTSNGAFVAVGLRFSSNSDLSNTPQSGYVAGLSVANGAEQWMLFRVTAGSAVQLGTAAATLVAGQTVELRFEAVGSALKVFENGVQKISVTDATFAGPGRPVLWFANQSTATTGAPMTRIEVNDGEMCPVYTNDFSYAWQGDSLSTGFPSPFDPTIPHRVGRLLRTCLGTNFAQDGKSAQTIAGQNATTMTPAFVVEGTRPAPLAVLCAGPNDMVAGRSNSDILADMVSWHSAQKTTGYITVALTIVPNGILSGLGKNAQRLSLNADILAGATGADIVLDPASDPILLNNSNTAIYSDGTHLTSFGKQRYAEVVAAWITGKLIRRGARLIDSRFTGKTSVDMGLTVTPQAPLSIGPGTGKRLGIYDDGSLFSGFGVSAFQTWYAFGGTGSNRFSFFNTDGGTELWSLSESGLAVSAVQNLSLGSGAATFAATRNRIVITGHAAGNSISTITGLTLGTEISMTFVDNKITFVNNNTGAANTIRLKGGANFTPDAGDVLTLEFFGTSLVEKSRSVNH